MISADWTLFLDRDGVINKRLMGDYVKNTEEFEFLPGVLDALKGFKPIFNRIVVVTNQQGIGKGIMSEEDLALVHDHMLEAIESIGARIDKVYHCPELAEKNAACRKPNIGMAEQAVDDFPEIDFTKSIMVGDSISDLEFGKNAGMKTVYIHDSSNTEELADEIFESLQAFYQSIA